MQLEAIEGISSASPRCVSFDCDIIDALSAIAECNDETVRRGRRRKELIVVVCSRPKKQKTKINMKINKKSENHKKSLEFHKNLDFQTCIKCSWLSVVWKCHDLGRRSDYSLQSKRTRMAPGMPIQESRILEAQLESLDDTDCYASVWNDILASQKESRKNLWGGRGKGGRGLSRKTVQPYDIVVEDVTLQYLLGDVCLEGATLKLLHGHTYALCGMNGCGKSTLLQRMHTQKIPGWSSQWISLYLPPKLPTTYLSLSPLQVVEKYRSELSKDTRAATEERIEAIQAKIDELDMEKEQETMESLCEELAGLEGSVENESASVEQSVRSVLVILEIDHTIKSCRELSPGQQKRILICVAMILGKETNLLLLDEPSAFLDVFGLIELRRVLELYPGTTVLVSHDVDFLNDVATDIIEMHDHKLWYFAGNYDNYRIMKEQLGMHDLRKSAALEKKRDHLMGALQNLKERPVPRRGGSKKKAKAVSSHRKKIERHAHLEKAVSAVSPGNSIIPVRRGLTAQQRLNLAETLQRVPDKAIQFNFPPTDSQWGEPLITALEVGFGYQVDGQASTGPSMQYTPRAYPPGCDLEITKKDGFLFDCVDFCLDEGARHCVSGPSASGKSTLLQILSKRRSPLEGVVHHASGVQVGYFDASEMHEYIIDMAADKSTTAIDYLTSKYPDMTEKELRGHLTGFGLPPTVQAMTPIVFLSSGEKCRLILAVEMMTNPPILVLDDPTLYLDVSSVYALVYGLQKWDGSLLVVSSDANFLRSLHNLKCSVLLPGEGKLRRVDGGIDTYLKTFQV